MSIQVHHRNYPDAVFLRCIEHTIGKAMYQSSPNLTVQHLSGQGISQNALNRGPDLGGEIQSKPRRAFFVVRDGFQKLRFRLRAEVEVHFV